MKETDILKDLLHDISEVIVYMQSNMTKRAVNQLYELHGKINILIKLKEHNKDLLSIIPEEPYYITYRGRKISDIITPNK